MTGAPEDSGAPGATFRTESLPGVTVVTVSGELDLLAAGPARAALDEVLVTGAPALVVDLSDLGFIDSIGLGILVRTHKKARVLRTPFALACPDGTPAHRLLSLTGVLAALRVHASLDEALTGVLA